MKTFSFETALLAAVFAMPGHVAAFWGKGHMLGKSYKSHPNKLVY